MLDFRDLSDTNSLVSEQGVIPAFDILDIFILALVARQISLGSYFRLHGFVRFDYVMDFRFGFIWISGVCFSRTESRGHFGDWTAMEHL